MADSIVKEFSFRGLMAPHLFSLPLKKSSTSVNLDIIPKYAAYLKNKGIEAVLVNGTTGEGMSMSVNERKSILEKWAIEAKRLNLTVMVQIGGTTTQDVFELAKHASEQNVDAVLCLPQLYIKPQTEVELVRYLSLVAGNCPQIPLFYYHIPKYTGVNLNIAKVISVAQQKIPSFKGVKDSSSNLEQIVHAIDSNAIIFLGTNAIMLGSLALGFDSFILTPLNIYPEASQAIVKAFLEENFDKARQLQKDLNVEIQKISQKGSFTAAMKAEFNQQCTDFTVGPLRAPLANVK